MIYLLSISLACFYLLMLVALVSSLLFWCSLFLCSLKFPLSIVRHAGNRKRLLAWGGSCNLSSNSLIWPGYFAKFLQVSCLRVLFWTRLWPYFGISFFLAVPLSYGSFIDSPFLGESSLTFSNREKKNSLSRTG